MVSFFLRLMKYVLHRAVRYAVFYAIVAASGYSNHAQESPADVPTNGAAFARIEIRGIQNAFHVTDRVYSGSQPEGDEAFGALARLGVKTIITVDGSKPDVEAARKHGLRYIHLPFGYDGVPTNRVAELAKAAGSQSGTIFVHCHHGMHRGPTAVAIICEATANWTTNRAEAWMREAGTAADYAGLYRSAATFRKPTLAQLDAVHDLPEVAMTSSLVDAMVAIDGHFSALKESQKAGWQAPPGHADISPAHEAIMLLEQFREIKRTENTFKRPADFRAKLSETEKAAESLHEALRETSNTAMSEAAFKQVGTSCAACHQRYRNE
jgi:protein tyrosine phosphatase (PTP) superfamily phosphohydrolase (DUF442 family)